MRRLRRGTNYTLFSNSLPLARAIFNDFHDMISLDKELNKQEEEHLGRRHTKTRRSNN